MSKKTMICLAGVSGSGKSTLAEFLMQLPEFYGSNGLNDPVLCCADDHFMVDGEYKFDASKLGAAHEQCKEKFEQAIEDETPLIIVSNTTTNMGHALPYLRYAEDNGYISHYVAMIPWRKNQQNTHGVPQKTLENQTAQLNGTIKACHDNFIQENVKLNALRELTNLSQEMGLYD